MTDVAPGEGETGRSRYEGGSPADSHEVDRPTRNRTARFAWGAVAVILLGVVILVAYALTGSPATPQTVHRAVTPAAVTSEVTHVPAKVFDTVATTATGITLTPPRMLAGQPPLQSGGKPEVLYVGAEFCPFCGAERWPLIVALSRFGHFSSLYDMQSSQTSVFPGIQTFTFVGTGYQSRYVTFSGIELYSDVAGIDGAFTRIGRLSPAQAALVNRYDDTPGVPSGSIPFVDIGNRMIASTSGFSPAVLVHQAQATIAGDLSQSDQPVGQAVVASANYLTAGICASTGQQPASVCTSPGVVAAAQALSPG